MGIFFPQLCPILCHWPYPQGLWFVLGHLLWWLILSAICLKHSLHQKNIWKRVWFFGNTDVPIPTNWNCKRTKIRASWRLGGVFYAIESKLCTVDSEHCSIEISKCTLAQPLNWIQVFCKFFFFFPTKRILLNVILDWPNVHTIGT